MFKNITSEIKQYYGALFLSYRQRTECSISQLCNTNCVHSISGRSKHGWAFRKKFPKSPIRPAGSHFCRASVEWTLIDLRFYIIKNLLGLFFVQWFYRCEIFKSVWYARHFEYSCKRCSLNDWKQTAQRLKLQERLLTINKRNIIRWNIYRDNNFHSRRQVLKCLWKSLFMF